MTSYQDLFGIFFRPGEATEVRAVGLSGKNPLWQGWTRDIVHGFFDDPDKFAAAVQRLDGLKRAEGIYFVMSPVAPSLLGRASNRLVAGKQGTGTSDADTLCHRWLLIDTDPNRPKGISATNEEAKSAIACRNKIRDYLGKNEWPLPLMAFSANGGHLPYLLEDLPNTDEIKNLKSQALKSLNHMFGGNGVSVDETVFNASRVVKLYGTWGRKGDSTVDRPHRQSVLEEVPSPLRPVTLDQLKWLAAQAPEEVKPSRQKQQKKAAGGSTLGPLDVAKYLNHYSINFKEKNEATRTVYGLMDGCLFDQDHTANEASIIQARDGTLYYQCFHNGCKSAGRTWHEAREKISGKDNLAEFCEGYDPTKNRTRTKKGTVVAANQASFYLTDMGNAERLVDQHGQDLRYCHPWRKWFVWDGTRWKQDDTGAVKRMAKKTVRTIYVEAAGAVDKYEAKDFADHARRSEANTKIKALLSLAESEHGIPVIPEQLDSDHWLLNCLSGTIDLKTGATRPHNRADLITKVAPVQYNPEATCPLWDAFLDRIMDGNQNLIRFLQKSAGYSLTGSTTEHALFIFWGAGANGKSTYIQAISAVMGDYGQQTPMATFMLKSGDGIPNDIAALRGSRFVSAVESEGGKRMAESLIKWLTGGDTVTARFMRAEFFSYVPTFKIFLATNHKPEIWGTDHAMWRRIRLVPFEVTIAEKEQDPDLGEKLKAELSGILAWAVRGCMAWQQERLGMPEEVKAATDVYRGEMDILGGFLDECCLVAEAIKVPIKDLFKAYDSWCDQNGDKALGKRRFGQILKDRGVKYDKIGRPGKWHWLGIGLLTDADMESQVPEGSTANKPAQTEKWETV